MIPDDALSTHDAILDRGMQLFNEIGIESVSVNRVAESLGISPGNLTYHFKRKEHLVAALLDRLEAQMSEGLSDFPYTSGAWSFVNAYAGLFGVTWRHRGLFNSAPYLIQSTLVPAMRIRELHAHITGMMVEQTERLIEQGFFERIKQQQGIRMLIDCIWWQWLGCLRMDQLREPGKPNAVGDIIKDGINRCIFLARPYMRKDYPAKLHQAVQELDLEGRSALIR